MKTVVFTFGRFQPLTSGHEKVIDQLIDTAAWLEGDAMVFPSHTHDPKKNPLPYTAKLIYLRACFPDINIVDDDSIINPFYALKYLSNEGYKKVIMIVGSDRVESFDKQVRLYIKHKDPVKSFEFDEFEVWSAGDREGAVSATQLRNYAVADDFEAFRARVPSTMILAHAWNMFYNIRNGMDTK